MWIVLALLVAAVMAMVAVIVLASLVAIGAVLALVAAAFALAWFVVSLLGPLLLVAGLAVVVARALRGREPRELPLVPQPATASALVPTRMSGDEGRRFRVKHEREMMRLFDETLETRSRALQRID